jgi:hypothetical protein
MPTTRRRSKWALMTPVATVVAACVAACSGGMPPADDGTIGVGGDDASGTICATPGNGCACSPEGKSIACGFVKESSGSFVTCAEGLRTCSGGAWGPCVASSITFQSTEPLGGNGIIVHTLGMNSDSGTGSTNCAVTPCDPGCQTFVDTSNGVDAASPLVSTDAGGWTLAGEGGAALEASTLCFVTLTGTVYDPAALNPVPNAVVAIPFAGTPIGSGSPPSLATGVPLSDACGGTGFSALRAATANVDGTFSLAGVPVQSQVSVVVQIGRWRRVVSVNTSACACGSSVEITKPGTTCVGTTPSCAGSSHYAGTAGCNTRLPRSQSEGNIPHIAIATGALDPEECTLYRMGVAASEFTDENGAGRVHMFIDAIGSGGSTLPSPAANHDASYLLGFTCPLAGCQGSTPITSTSGMVNPDFETGDLSGWTATGSPVTNDTTAAYSGTHSAQMGDTKSKKTGTQTLVQANMVAPANVTTLQFFVQPHCGGGGGDGFTGQLQDVTNGTTWNWNGGCKSSGNWSTYNTNGVVVAGDKFTLTLTSTNPANDASYAYVDAVAWTVTAAPLLNNYDLVMLPCDGGDEYHSWSWDKNYGDFNDDAGRKNLVSYANVGGRVFTSHWGREWIERADTNLPTGPFPNVATWLGVQPSSGANPPYPSSCAPYASGGGCNPADPTTGFFDTASANPRPTRLANWMGLAAVSGNATTMTINGARYDVTAVTTSSVDFVDANSDNGGEKVHDVVQDFTFDTPLGSASPLGRVMFTDMHLASGTTTGNFPSNCPAQGTALSSQEDAAEFLLFDLGDCVSGQPVPGQLPTLITTGNGTNSTCSGGSSNDGKIEPSSCIANADCEMDFHCASGACVWSGGTGYTDPSCTDASGNPAVDLTIGAPCGMTSGTFDIPICNRGTGTLAVGTAIHIENSGNGGSASAPWNCASPPSPDPPNVSGGSATCSYVLPVALGPGQCTDIDTSTTAGAACSVLEVGERFLYINYDQSIPECGTGFSGVGPGCMNNTTHTKTTGSSCPPACGTATKYSPGTFTRDFDGVCPAGTVAVWHLFTWSGLTPLDSNLDFKSWTADTEAQLGVQYPTAVTLESPAPDNHANGYVDSQLYATDVDTLLVAGGYPASGTPPHASHLWLRVNMVLDPSSDNSQAPTLLSWNQAYDCVASE